MASWYAQSVFRSSSESITRPIASAVPVTLDGTRHVTTCIERHRLQSVVMGVHKAVYVRDEDAELWQRAERYAKARRMPVSGLVMAALEQYLQKAEETP
jgi:hypothetical protein